MRALAALALLPALAACAVVEVRADSGRPQLSVYPLGVRIERGDAQAVSVSTRAVGLTTGCGFTSAGAISTDCDVIDTKACSAALVHARSTDPTIIGRLAGEARAVCPKPQGDP